MAEHNDIIQYWDPVYKLIEKKSVLEPEEDADPVTTKDFLHTSKVLVLGAGGLGCEILKDLALSGFKNISVIDMDTIDVSNLNRQFLFQEKDVGREKAVIAADFVNTRVQGCKIMPYVGDLTKKPIEFYKDYNIIISGLDAIEPRRWINALLVKFAREGNIIPFIDGGSEGFGGQVRVMLPTISACFDCGLDLIPPAVTFPLCTIASNPRLPEHCIEFAILKFPEQHGGTTMDGDKEEDVKWCFEKALERSKQYNIEGVTEKLTLGVMKRIIPAVASTNSIIAALSVHEALKLCINFPVLKNYITYSGRESIYTNTYELLMKDCPVCGERKTVELKFPQKVTVQGVIEQLKDQFQFKNPSLFTSGGFPIYRKGMALTEDNYEKSIKEIIGDDYCVIARDVALGPDGFITIQIIFDD
ncbi:MAG: putative ubiquitin-activating enzyme E1 C [Streblomastix strix]|uniref:NEDD8-activating enzyme E1 catalytic subunit n=1 Tax=Streblomastix strix TaxID=222440 RepID=A0A5J4W9Z4_9EUKA|nr:MAG: putative ubiquitin-activating enzyme E1 C [Streblomastix strix]